MRNCNIGSEGGWLGAYIMWLAGLSRSPTIIVQDLYWKHNFKQSRINGSRMARKGGAHYAHSNSSPGPAIRYEYYCMDIPYGVRIIFAGLGMSYQQPWMICCFCATSSTMKRLWIWSCISTRSISRVSENSTEKRAQRLPPVKICWSCKMRRITTFKLMTDVVKLYEKMK